MVTVDGTQLTVRQVDSTLHTSADQVAFTSSETDGGGANIFFPQRPAIAALPDSDLVHIAFTASRILPSMVTDSDIYGVFRGPGGAFSAAMFVDAPGGMSGNAAPQDFVTLAIDPVTKKAIAAWTALEDRGFGIYSTVYVGFFTAQNTWITGSDLNVFMQVGTNNSYPLFPQHQNDLWDAFSPQLAVQPDGRIWLSMLAGRREIMGANSISPYLVGFAFDAGSPVGGNGWYRPPAAKMSDTLAFDPRAAGNYVPESNSALAADSQISVYGAFVEGVGTLNAMENRGVFVTRP
jgi:hypothetical protein